MENFCTEVRDAHLRFGSRRVADRGSRSVGGNRRTGERDQPSATTVAPGQGREPALPTRRIRPESGEYRHGHSRAQLEDHLLGAKINFGTRAEALAFFTIVEKQFHCLPKVALIYDHFTLSSLLRDTQSLILRVHHPRSTRSPLRILRVPRPTSAGSCSLQEATQCYTLTFRCVNCGKPEAYAAYSSDIAIREDDLRFYLYEARCRGCGWKGSFCGFSATLVCRVANPEKQVRMSWPP